MLINLSSSEINHYFEGKEPSLIEILNAKERIYNLQQECLIKHSCVLLGLSLLLPGGVKNAPIYDYIFKEGLNNIKEYFKRNNIAPSEEFSETSTTGYYALFCLNTNPLSLKQDMIILEESQPIARLWDIDIINSRGENISRTNIDTSKGVRKCLICNEEAKVCTKKRTHSINELREKIAELTIENLLARYISRKITRALINEVLLTPKPGLVDADNSGAHKDMDKNTFLKSAKALQPYFEKFIHHGYKNAKTEPIDVFNTIRKLGLEAEEAMCKATNKVNTHKGSIFLFGIIATAIGWLYGNNEEINIDNIQSFTKKATIHILDELHDEKAKLTAGIILFRKYGLTGARGEVFSGYETAINFGLPTLKRYKNHPVKYAQLQTLMQLIANNNDTNVAHRGGIENLEWMKATAESISNKNHSLSELEYEIKLFDNECIERNLSPGGSADLLAVSNLFYTIETDLPSFVSKLKTKNYS